MTIAMCDVIAIVLAIRSLSAHVCSPMTPSMPRGVAISTLEYVHKSVNGAKTTAIMHDPAVSKTCLRFRLCMHHASSPVRYFSQLSICFRSLSQLVHDNGDYMGFFLSKRRVIVKKGTVSLPRFTVKAILSNPGKAWSELVGVRSVPFFGGNCW